MSNRACFSLFLSLLPVVLPAAEPAAVNLAQEVVFFEEPNRSKAFEMLNTGQMHVYAFGLSDPEMKARIEASANVDYTLSYGSVAELTINPAEFSGGRFNPFAVAPLREALNWLFDRNYIAQEICVGLARPKYVPLVSAFPDYARLADVCRLIEIKYAFNVEKAREIITREMQARGATLVNGKWSHGGAPLPIVLLIRTEDERKRIGDYVASQLESVGFTVDRQYKTASEAGPIWIGSEPSDGRWHLYTGGWINTYIDRDQGNMFNSYYTPKGRPDTLWQAYKPSEELATLADRLARNDYTTQEQRREMMVRALELSSQEAYRIWLVDKVDYFPKRKDVSIASDLAGGVNGSFLWAHTAIFKEPGPRSMRIGMPSILTGPWNPIAGTNWVFDSMIIKGTGADGAAPDPYTGLFLNMRIKSAEVSMVPGTPMGKTLDWVTLETVPKIDVPGDAWLTWDSAGQRFGTVQEKHPTGLTARTKAVIRFNDDLFKRKWHDGTTVAFADLMYALVVSFERVAKGSPIYDEASAPVFETFLEHFRGFRIVQEDPLVFEYYSDAPYPDAEFYAFSASTLLYGTAQTGLAPWQSLYLGAQAEGNKQLAFSEDKAEKLKIEKMSYIGGPSLAILDGIARQAETEGPIPYPNMLGKYITPEQSKARFAALRKWYEAKKHFWVGNGPYYIEAIHALEKTVVVRRADDFQKVDPRLVSYTEPHIATVQVTGPNRVTIGTAADFKINVTFKGQPYPTADVDFVRFLLFNARGDLVMVGDAEAGAAGEWIAKVPPEKTRDLTAGATRLEVAVAPKVVSIASFGSMRFVSLGAR